MRQATEKTRIFKGTHLDHSILPYKTPPYTFKGSRVLMIWIKTSYAILQELVPPPLTAIAEGPSSESGTMLIGIAVQNLIDPIASVYEEVYLLIPASFEGSRGGYVALLYLDQTMPILLGREVWGWPKIDGEIHLIEDAGKVVATLERDGTTLLDATVRLGDPVVPPPPFPEDGAFLLKHIPSNVENAPPDVKKITSSSIQDSKVTKFQTGEATLKFGHTDSDPLDAIPIQEIIDASYVEFDYVLDHGEDVYVYPSPMKRVPDKLHQPVAVGPRIVKEPNGLYAVQRAKNTFFSLSLDWSDFFWLRCSLSRTPKKPLDANQDEG